MPINIKLEEITLQCWAEAYWLTQRCVMDEQDPNILEVQPIGLGKAWYMQSNPEARVIYKRAQSILGWCQLVFPGDSSNTESLIPREFIEVALHTLNEIGPLHTPADFHHVCSAIAGEDCNGMGVFNPRIVAIIS